MKQEKQKKKKNETSNKESLSKGVKELQELRLDYKVQYPISDTEPFISMFTFH